ncbi:MAG: endolytic transglycosylase MltG [Patescibacteria group bacterium]|nr:endolytic transglycosylase MltG [Patescibacteria group bacterium]
MHRIIRYLFLVGLSLLATALLLSFIFGRSLVHSLSADSSFFDRLDSLFRKEEPAKSMELRPEETVRLIEGWNSRDMAQYFERQGIWQGEEFLEASGFPQVDYNKVDDLPPLVDYSSEFSFLADKPKNRSLEGYLYPDTYRIFASSSPDELIKKMLNNFDSQLTDKMRADIKAQGKSIYEIVTMASILEKEAPMSYSSGDNRDARIISGIFWRRIAVGQALQSCATLAYILGVNKAQYTTADTKIESPYNTYQYRDLPPGPISNPGILAIEAAIYPLSTSYNYFLTPSGSSNIVYATTYAEHLNNKRKYLP